MKIILETEPPVVREYVEEDAEACLRLNSDPEVLRFVPDSEIHSLDALGFSHISASTLFSESRNSANQRSCAAIGATSIGLVSKRTFLETSASWAASMSWTLK